MSKLPSLPSRVLMPGTSPAEMMPVCPATVKQTMAAVHPLAGAALVSPDITNGSALGRSLPTLACRPSDRQTPLTLAQKTTAFGGSEGLISPDISVLAPRSELKPKGGANGTPLPTLPNLPSGGGSGGMRLNKFVRRLHDMLLAEKDSGIVEWRRGLLVLHSTDAFAKTILPKYFNTRNFKTFRRQLNYYGFVHVRSFSTTGSTTTALWVNRDLAKRGSAEISSVLMLKRVEPCESAKTAEGRRVRKELAIFTVEEDIGVSPKSLQMEQIRSLALRAGVDDLMNDPSLLPTLKPRKPSSYPPIPTEVHLRPSPLAMAPSPVVPPPIFPKLAMKKARQVSPTAEEQQITKPSSPATTTEEAPDSQVSSVSSADSSPPPEAETQEAAAFSAAQDAADGDIGAANLLLMLSKGGPAGQ